VGDRDGKAGKSGYLVFNEEELECLKEVGKEYEGKTKLSKNPFEKYSLAWAAWIIGRIGGWKGYRKAGPAGPITMKRGLQQFSILFKGWLLRKALEVP
ncbi:MAG TPA: transposase, partial [Gammaproteobacteria bacterium]|nr:transposase [Gammaproteobacteria bacterium]